MEQSQAQPPTTERPPPAELFPIVGIGASAGGLEALTELLSDLPADSGMAFLVVQHLDPTHDSMLAEILAHKTAMPVREAVDGQEVAPDHVYIIAPNTTMTVAQRRLSLRRRADALGPPMPIDDLLESLAQDAGAQAIGVILSGTGSDGALGLQTIKTEGGVTFAQDEASARFAAMPRAAIALGCVDSVLAPRAIGQALGRIALHPMAQQCAADPDHADPQAVDEQTLRRIFRVLRAACNVDFSHYKRGTIRRRLERRLVLHQIAALPDYLTLLEADPAEAKALCHDFLINVTSFFRDPESYDDLAKTVWPRLLEGRSPKTPLRIWVPGCASGEEVYSIAISLLEHLGDRAAGMQIQIFGTDLSDAAIDTARAGQYIENVARDVSPERLERFFVRLNAHYQVAKRVRDLCIFSRHDVVSDPPFSRLDLVSCRNLLIYLGPPAQKRLMPIFHYALNPGGCLTLGPSETLPASSELFHALDNCKTKVYVRKAVPGRGLPPELMESHPARRAVEQPAARVDETQPPPELEQVQQTADRIAQSRYVPAGVLCDEALNIVQFRGDTGPYLVQPPGPPSIDLQKLARPGLLVDIGTAVAQVRKDGRPVRRTGLRVEALDGPREVDLEVIAVQPSATAQRWFLIFFESAAAAPPGSGARRGGPWASLTALWARRRDDGAGEQGEPARQVARLQQELEASRDYVRAMNEEHQSALEELKSAQEELLSSNEEFQSTNEELETAKEELQSANEELTTTNDELRHRNVELHALTERLQEAGEYADAIVATAREPMMVLDSSLRVLRVNQSFCRCFKVTRAATEGTLLRELGNRQWDIPALRRQLEQSLEAHGLFEDFELTHDFPEIGAKTMRLNARRLDWPDHKMVLLAIEDVTERNAMVQALRDGDRRKNEFLAMLGHELRNPLGAIRNALQIIESSGASAGAKQQALAMAVRQLRRETRLVDDLLDMSRISQGTIAIEKTPVDLVRLVREAVESMRHAFDGRGHELSVALPDGDLLVEGDATRLEQVVVNLLANSAKFTLAGGRIGVTLARSGRQALLTVSDNGIGIAPEVLPRVFDLFVQAKGLPDRLVGGLGLGLTLVRRIVELHGGSVEADSRGLGQGTRLVVRLPALFEAPVQAPEPAHEAANEAAVPCRILVVDDNADMASSMADLLRLDGHEVEISGDGLAAVEAAQRFDPQVVLLDIGLPGIDGCEVARRLRALPQTRAALLIALSGYGQAQDRRQSLAAGFDHHLVKPVDFERVTALIAERPVAPTGSAGT